MPKYLVDANLPYNFSIWKDGEYIHADMNLFFDTSALIKYFHREEGTDTVIALIQEKTHHIYILEIARIEMLSAVFQIG